MTLFNDVFRFAIIAEQVELNLMEFIFTISMSVSHSRSVSFSMLWTVVVLELLPASLKWFICCIFHTSSHMLGTILVCGPDHSICIFLLQAFSHVWPVLFLSVCLHLFCIIASKFFTSYKLLMNVTWAL